MITGFYKKKLEEKNALGEILKAARCRKSVSLMDAEAATKVRGKYLSALENGKWGLLPQRVYSRGFVLAYARYLSLDTKEILELFEKESAAHQGRQSQNLRYKESLKEAKVLITPKLLAYVGFSCFVIAVFSYIIYQVASFAGSPLLKVVTPENNSIIESDTVNLTGITDNNTIVTVNEENVSVTNDGRFSRDLKLHRGVNVIKVVAVNKIKKESSLVYTVEYRPRTAAANEDKSDSNF